MRLWSRVVADPSERTELELRSLYQRLLEGISDVPAPHRQRLETYFAWFLRLPSEARAWAVEAEARRLRPAAERLRKSRSRVLDAGCGFGFHSCYFASLGAEVTGVDLDRERLETAPLLAGVLEAPGVDFRLASIHTVLGEGESTWDVIWVNEAISHIEPVPPFLELCERSLNPNGVLVISDHNAANPLIRRQARLKRGSDLITSVEGPDGERVPYAQERSFSPRALASLLQEAGLRTVRYEPHGFIPVSLRRGRKAAMLRQLERVLRRIPLARPFAGSYTIVALSRRD